MRSSGKGFVQSGIFVTLTREVSPWQPTHVLYVCFVLLDVHVEFLCYILYFLIYIHSRHTDTQCCLSVDRFQICIGFHHLIYMYFMISFMCISRKRTRVVPHHVPARPGMCGNLRFSGGPPLSTSTLTVNSKDGDWRDTVRDVPHCMWQCVASVYPNSGSDNVGRCTKSQSMYTPQYIFALAQIQTGSLLCDSREVRRPHIHIHTHSTYTLSHR